MISNSGKDENGRYIGGKAGDQTGKEWHIIPWYNRPWNCVLRYNGDKKDKVRKMIAEMATAAAKNDKVGYDQGQRTTYYNELSKVGYKPEKIKNLCESDCSGGVCSNVKGTGYRLGIKVLQNIPITTTHYMREVFKKAGFTVLTDKKYLESDAYLLKGDILLNDAHHTATNITNGKYAKVEKKETKKAAKTATKKAYSGTFPVIPINGSLHKDNFGKQVKYLQKFLNWAIDAKLSVDGKFGPKTEKAVKDFQKKYGLVVDGHFGAKSLAKAKTIKK